MAKTTQKLPLKYILIAGLLFLTTSWLIFSLIYSIINEAPIVTVVRYSFELAFCVVAIFYGLIGYVFPNTRILKYTFILYGLVIAAYGLLDAYQTDLFSKENLMFILASEMLIFGGIMYFSGRLGRWPESLILIIVISVLLIANYVFYITLFKGANVDESTLSSIIGSLFGEKQQVSQFDKALFYINAAVPMLLWASLTSIYLLRAKNHETFKK